MGRVVSSIFETVVGVALIVVGIVVPGAQFLIGAGISLTMAGLAGIVQGPPKSPKQNQATSQRLMKSLDPEAFRKIVFGKTCGGADERYWEVWGTNDENFDEVIAVAGHQINSFQGFWIEDKAVTFTSNAANAPFSGVLSRYTSDGTVGNAALPVGAGSLWTAAAKFRGSAHYCLRWVYSQDKLPQGIPSRYTCEIEGALLYDPRKDSTRGGTGTHRAEDQTTWQYSPTDSNGKPLGRNNALQVLWYLIGWRINDTGGNPVLVAGRGVDLADIDFASFIAAANDCEAQGYYTDCILSTGDSHQTNESLLTADGGLGTLMDPGGFWSYKINRNDTGVSDVDLTDDDVVDTGPVLWVPTWTLSNQYNRVVGQYVDPSTLYQSKPYPQVVNPAYETADGFKKRKTINYQAIQDPVLAQKVGTIILNQSRFQGEFTAKFSYKALKTQLYGVVTLTLSQYGFVAKPFRVLAMTVAADGVEMRLGELDPSLWTAGSTGTSAGGGTGSPGLLGGRVSMTGLAAASAVLAGSSVSMDAMNISWNPAPGNVTASEIQYKLTADSTWTVAYSGKPDATTVKVPVLPFSQYDVRGRHVSSTNQIGPWTTLSVTSGAVGSISYTSSENVFRNPDFQNDMSYWTTTGTVTRIAGTISVLSYVQATVTGSTLTSLIRPIPKGGQLFLSYDINRSLAASNVANAVSWYSTDGTLLSTTTVNDAGAPSASLKIISSGAYLGAAGAGAWTTSALTLVPPAGAASFSLRQTYTLAAAQSVSVTDFRAAGTFPSATLGADWLTNMLNLPANLAALVGTEVIDNQGVFDVLAADNVLNKSEKVQSLIPREADMENRYTDLSNRAAALGLSTTALTTARTAWKNLLAAYSPAWNDTSLDTTIFVNGFADLNFPTGWSANFVTTAASGIYTTVTDSNASQFGNISRAVSNSGVKTYAAGLTVKKDAVGKATRFSLFRLNFLGGTAKSYGVSFDTSTGEFAATDAGIPTAYGVCDLGSDWFVYAQATTTSGNTSVAVEFHPAVGSGALSGANYLASKTGSVTVDNPVFTQGTVANLGHAYMHGTFAAYAKAMTTLAASISTTDSQLSNYVDGTTVADVTYDSTGATLQNGPDLNWYLRSGTSGAIVTSGVTMTYTVITGNVNGFTPASGAQTITPSSGVGTLSVTSMTVDLTQLKVSVTSGGVTRTYFCTLNRLLAAQSAPSGGGTGPPSASQTSGFNQITTAYGTYFALSNTLTFTTGAAQTSVSAVISLNPRMFRTADNSGPWDVLYKWQRNISGTWTDQGTVQHSSPDPEITFDSELGKATSQPGTINSTQTLTGLPSSTAIQFRLMCCLAAVDSVNTFAYPTNSAAFWHTVPTNGGVFIS